MNKMIRSIKNIVARLGLNNLKFLYIDYSESRIRLRMIRKRFNLSNYHFIRISVNNSTFNKPIQLQSPGRLGVVNTSIFVTTLQPHINVVINSPNPFVPLKSKLNENWLFHIEPPGYIHKYGYNQSKLLSKFTRVYTSDPTLYNQGGKYIACPPYVHWHLEVSSYNKMNKLVHDYDFLENQTFPPNKTVNLSAINSNINHLPGHNKRAQFIQELCESGVGFNLYGGSNWKKYSQYVDNAPDGKWPIFSESKYILVIENEVAPFYWTEKITDAILCWGMPIYFGCPNIDDYLPEGSFIKFDISAEDSIERLKNILKSDFYEKNIENLAKARTLILEKYNLLNFIDNELNRLYTKPS